LISVDVEVEQPANGPYKLTGRWVESVDDHEKDGESNPEFKPPETTGDFKYMAKNREFLNVMAYYYLDQLITYLHGLGCTAYNNAVLEGTKRVRVDAQGYSIDNSSSGPDINAISPSSSVKVACLMLQTLLLWCMNMAIRYTEYLVSAGPLLIPTNKGGADFLAGAWLDRFNDHQFQREEVFPWDNCPAVHWDSTRRLDRPERFDDSNFSSYGHDLRGDIFVTALWDCFLNLGGSLPNGKRPQVGGR